MEDTSSGSCCANRGVSCEPHASGGSLEPVGSTVGVSRNVVEPVVGVCGGLVVGLGRSGNSS